VRRAAVALTGLALLLGGCMSTTAGAPTSAEQPGGGESGTACDYRRASSEDAPVGLPPKRAADSAQGLSLTTSAGELAFTLDAEAAPCTVRSIAFLAEEGFYDATHCHRMTSAPALKVLQCGDPVGNGTGGPGYTIPDENPTDLEPAGEPDAQTGESNVRYPRGTVAMANIGTPHSGGSQFFLVYGDSVLPPTYAVFGTLDPTGLTTLDAVAAAGIVPGRDPQTGMPSPADGTPVTGVEITEATVR